MAVNPTIELYIDKLVLHGFPPHQRRHIAQAVEAELTRLLSQNGIPASLHSDSTIPLVSAPGFTVGKSAKGKAIGNKIAGSVYKSLKK